MCSNTEGKESNEIDAPEDRSLLWVQSTYETNRTFTTTKNEEVEGKQMLQCIKLY